MHLATGDWLALLSYPIGWFTAWWFARKAASDAEEQHLAQLEQMRRHHQQEMDLLHQQGQNQLTHLKTVLHRLEVPGPVARDQHGVPTGRTLTTGTISTTLEGV
jgi:hypothetical protein